MNKTIIFPRLSLPSTNYLLQKSKPINHKILAIQPIARTEIYKCFLISFLLISFMSKPGLCSEISKNNSNPSNSVAVLDGSDSGSNSDLKQKNNDDEQNPDLDSDSNKSINGNKDSKFDQNSSSKFYRKKNEEKKQYSRNTDGKFAIYAGVDAQYQNMSMGRNNATLSDGTVIDDIVRDQYPHEAFSANFFLGLDNLKNFKIEIGHSLGDDSKTNNSTGIGANSKGELGKYSTKTYPNKYSTYNKIEIESNYIEFKPYKMLDGVAAFYGIFGIAKYEISISEKSTYTLNGKEQILTRNSKASKMAPSFGAGLEFWFIDSVFFRTQVKYTPIDIEVNTGGMAGTIPFKNMFAISAGLGYSFRI